MQRSTLLQSILLGGTSVFPGIPLLNASSMTGQQPFSRLKTSKLSTPGYTKLCFNPDYMLFKDGKVFMSPDSGLGVKFDPGKTTLIRGQYQDKVSVPRSLKRDNNTRIVDHFVSI